MSAIIKYVRTAHLEGSRLQTGDSTDGQMSLIQLDKLHPNDIKVWEEKIDGANTGISFSDDADLILQSRGTADPRHEQFNLFKRWAKHHENALFDILGTRYLMYGEFCGYKHTVWYNRLPHFFLEFDILDKETGRFLNTKTRHSMLDGSPVVSVPVLTKTLTTTSKQMNEMIVQSLYKSQNWQEELYQAAFKVHKNEEYTRVAINETDASSKSEGLYLKVENDQYVTNRFKFVRPDFLQTIIDSGTHWAQRKLIPNQLAPDVDIWK